MTLLTAWATLVAPDLEGLAEAVADSVAVFGGRRDGAQILFGFGTATVAVHPQGLELMAQAQTLDALGRLKEVIASSAAFHGRAYGATVFWRGDGTAAHQLAPFRLLTVIGAEQVKPRMRRVRLAGADMGRFAALGGLHVRLLLPTPANPDPVWPVQGPDGLPHWPDPARRPAARIYTIRALDVAAGWIDIDFVLHAADGIAADWARAAAPGDTVGVIGPLGRPLKAADWYGLAADESGLPALARILEGLPLSAQGEALILAQDETEQQNLSAPTGVRLRWFFRSRGESLVVAARNLTFPTDQSVYGWFAGEASDVEALRPIWKAALGADRCVVAAYWRAGERSEG